MVRKGRVGLQAREGLRGARLEGVKGEDQSFVWVAVAAHLLPKKAFEPLIASASTTERIANPMVVFREAEKRRGSESRALLWSVGPGWVRIPARRSWMHGCDATSPPPVRDQDDNQNMHTGECLDVS